jgi:oligopeptidase B
MSFVFSRTRYVLLLAALLPVPAAAAGEPRRAADRQPPVAPVMERSFTLHGVALSDPYAGLKDRNHPAVGRYIEQENLYGQERLAPLRPLADQLYREMLQRIKETDDTPPVKDGRWWYYSRTEAGKPYPIHARKKETRDADEEILLDLNALCGECSYLALGEYEVSDDGRLLAYSLDRTGSREYTLRVRDLEHHRELPETIRHVTSVAWSSDGTTLFYVTEDAAKRPYRLYRHQLGATAADQLVYEEKDEHFSLEVERSRSKALIVLTSASYTATEVRFIPADRPQSPPTFVTARRPEHEYYVAHRGEELWIRTNHFGRNFAIATAPVSDPRLENWKPVVPHRDEVMIEGLDLFRDHYVLLERQRAVPRLRVVAIAHGTSTLIAQPDPVYTIEPDENPEFASPTYRFRYESPRTPESIYAFDLRTGEQSLLKRTEIPGGFDPAHYRCERIEISSSDGAPVPVSIVSATDHEKDGKSPLLLNGYGAYGDPYDVGFSASDLSLLDRGVVLAFAHVRGGGDLGKRWHDDGRLLHKRNSFDDFIAVAEGLVARGYAARGRIGIRGGSAGGLLVAAVINMRPELWKTAIVDVPFVDVINTMLDPTIPLTVGEFEEWGDPRNLDDFRVMRSYSPYDNITPHPYPAMLVRTSLNDSQVMYWEPLKYVARLRAAKAQIQDETPLLLQVNMNAGHDGSSGRYDQLHELAWDFAFLLHGLRSR